MYAPCCRLHGASLCSEGCWCFKTAPTLLPPSSVSPAPCEFETVQWCFFVLVTVGVSGMLWKKCQSLWMVMLKKRKIKKRENIPFFVISFVILLGSRLQNKKKKWRSGAHAWSGRTKPDISQQCSLMEEWGEKSYVIEQKFLQLPHWADTETQLWLEHCKSSAENCNYCPKFD